jgi:ankyrin repeat domain-containing protein 50
MMDGFSVAASAAGIISLGIQVTQSLIDFYEAYKGQKLDTANIAEKLQNLLAVFESLRRQLTNRKFPADEQALLQSIEGSIEDCEESVKELQTKIEKFKHDSGNSIQAAFRNTTRRLSYPFKQSTLRKLDADIDEIVSNLKFALVVLQQKDIGNVQDDINNAKAVLDLVRATQVSSTIHDWLKAPDASVEFNEACKTKHPGTGLWFIKGSQFSAWLVERKPFLWLTGFAGCGKSVLCSTAIQHTIRHRRSNPRVGIAFFFFTFKNDSKQDASAMLRALVLQLSSQLNNTHALLSRLHERYHNATPPSRDLEDCLHQLVQAFDHVYIILDALDESPRDKHRQGVLEALVDIREWAEPGVHILVTSRDEPDIRAVIYDELHASPGEVVPMKNASIDKDIASFISGCLKDRRDLQKFKAYHDQIEKALTQRANGVCVLLSPSKGILLTCVGFDGLNASSRYCLAAQANVTSIQR